MYYQAGNTSFGITEWQLGKVNHSVGGGTGQDLLPPA